MHYILNWFYGNKNISHLQTRLIFCSLYGRTCTFGLLRIDCASGGRPLCRIISGKPKIYQWADDGQFFIIKPGVGNRLPADAPTTITGV
jgi:hypothetical protein